MIHCPNLCRWLLKPALLAIFLSVYTASAAAAENGLSLRKDGPVYEVPAQKSLDLLDEVTLEAWVKADRMDQAGGRIIDKSASGTQQGYMLDTYPGNSLRFLNAKDQCRFDAQLPADRWTHVAGVYSSSKHLMRLYLNGRMVAKLEDGEFPLMTRSAVPLRIGCDPEGGNRFHGSILRAAVYRRALSSAEIEKRASTEMPATIPDVLGEWNFTSNPGRKIMLIAGVLALTIAGASQNTEFTGAFTGEAEPPKEPMSLWYRRPAKQWVEALAIGNGRIGAMVFGGIVNERLQLNEDTLYAGGPYDPNNPEALAALPEARRLIFAGKYQEASKLVGDKMMAKPLGQMPYQTLGDLRLTFPEPASVKDYRRDLNIDTAVVSVQYTVDGVTFHREVFASPVDQVLVVRLTADKPGQINFTVGLSTPQIAKVENVGEDTLVMRGVNGSSQGIPGALKFQARLHITCAGGKSNSANGQIIVTGADSATLLVSMATSYKSFKDVIGDPEAITKLRIQTVSQKSFDTLRNDHIEEHQRLFHRVKLDLGKGVNLPTDERIKHFTEGNDPQLAALYFQFGRYLLISSSRPGGQPANLQGLWNDSLTPPWGSKYTININTEMNYWPAETTNLGECVEPLVKMVEELSETGAKTAKVQWGAGGWVAHHNTDIWRASAPIDGPFWGFWPSGGAWLCRHLWDHYEYTGDRKFLIRVYPTMKGAAQFFLDTLVEEPKHKWLVTCPSISPENGHPAGVSITAGPTMDMQIIRDLFSECIDASEILSSDKDFRDKLLAARARLAPNQIGKAGQLQEWLEDWDMEAPEIHHRHVSHLYGLFPSSQIRLSATPELAMAARKSLEIRGDEATGWGLGWRLNLWARLQDAEHSYKILSMLLHPDRTYPNMFDAHPPFQIDGNFGGTSGIAEMLLQSHSGELQILPALPKAWPSGSVKGLRARGGYEVDIEWRDSELASVSIHSILGKSCIVRYAGGEVMLKLDKGKTRIFDGHLK